MKNTPFFSLLIAVILTSTVMVVPLAQAGERRKTSVDCLICKKPLYSYYNFKAYKNRQPVYAWEVSGHSKCDLKVAGTQKRVKHSTVGKGKIKAVQKKIVHKKKSETKEQPTERPVYANHDARQGAYGEDSIDTADYQERGHNERGSGYTAGYRGLSYGGGNFGASSYGELFRSAYARGRAVHHGDHGQTQQGTVTRRTTVTRSTPARGIFGGFSGTSTRTYTTRTRTSYSGATGGPRHNYSHGRGHHRRSR